MLILVSGATAKVGQQPSQVEEDPRHSTAGNLDSIAGRQIIELLRELNDAIGVTMLLVTHDPVWGSFCDRIVRFALK